VEKLGLIAPLRQASHFPGFDWLSTSLKYLAQSTNILSVATQVDLPFHLQRQIYKGNIKSSNKSK